MTGIKKYQDIYNRWWLGKMVRIACKPHRDFKECVRVELIGSDSFVYGAVKLHFKDGSSEFITPLDLNAFKPRKKDVLVLD